MFIQHISDRIYEIEINGTKKRVSIENLNLAFFLRDEQLANLNQNGKLKTKKNEKENIAKQNDFENKLLVKNKKKRSEKICRDKKT